MYGLVPRDRALLLFNPSRYRRISSNHQRESSVMRLRGSGSARTEQSALVRVIRVRQYNGNHTETANQEIVSAWFRSFPSFRANQLR